MVFFRRQPEYGVIAAFKCLEPLFLVSSEEFIVIEEFSFEEEALRFEPDSAALWKRLAQLYQLQGRSEDANRARERAAKLAEVRP